MADYKDLFLLDSTHKEMKITGSEGTAITNEELHGESFELTESICSEENLKFGLCEASKIKFKISYVRQPMKDKWLTVTIKIGNNDPYQIGQYKVFSDVPTADREFREITAYDVLYDIINSDVATWYNTLLPTDDSTVTLKQFRDSFFQHFNVTQESVDLPQDDVVIEKTIYPESLSGKTVINAICELNGCFGHIGRDGKFQYIFLEEMSEGLYPSDNLYPSDDLFPQKERGGEKISASHYTKAEYEDYRVERIDKLQIRDNENDIGAIVGTGTNAYVVQENFLVYGKSASDLEDIAETLFEIIRLAKYRPAVVNAVGNPCFTVGQGIRLNTKYELIQTYILQRTLKGIQALSDVYTSTGEERRVEQVNSVNESIIQLRGKTNELTRNIEETNSTIRDLDENLSSQILQNAEQISLKVSKDSIISEINQTAEQITIAANKINLNGLVNATEFTSKFATIQSLNATSANLSNLISQKASIESLNAVSATVNSLSANKLDASQFTANNISAMNITVKAANITGTLTANKISAGSVTINGQTASRHWDAIQVVTGEASRTTKSVNGVAVMTDYQLATKWIYFLGSGGVVS